MMAEKDETKRKFNFFKVLSQAVFRLVVERRSAKIAGKCPKGLESIQMKKRNL